MLQAYERTFHFKYMRERATPDHSISIFISYSRTNSDFVNRLEADLQARRFHTWVDRGRLEGGVNWLNTIQVAIDRCDVLLVVLSPEAMKSEYVLMEFRHAFHKKKLVVPLAYQPCEVTMDLNQIQWVNFQQSYERGLRDLLIALNPVGQKAPAPVFSPPGTSSPFHLPTTTEEPVLVIPQPAPPPPDADLMQLYREGLIAKSENNLERAAILWQQVLDRNPNFGNGTLAPEMEKLMKALHPIRVKRLRERADNAHNAGEWGQEIGTWKALLGLQPDDAQAKERIPIAEQNQAFAWMYQAAAQFVQEGKDAAAVAQLRMLMQYAPYYGDPASLAPNLNSKVGFTGLNLTNYVQRKEQEMQRAAQQRQLEMQNAAAQEEQRIQEFISQTRAERSTQVNKAIKRLQNYATITSTGALILFTVGAGFCGIQVAEVIHASLLTSIIGGVIGAIIGFAVIFGLIRTGVLSLCLFDKATYSIILETKGKVGLSIFKEFQKKYIVRKLEQDFKLEQWISQNNKRIFDIYLNSKDFRALAEGKVSLISEFKKRHPSSPYGEERKQNYEIYFNNYPRLPRKAICIDIYDIPYKNRNVPSAYPMEYPPPAPLPNWLNGRY